jgi:hypothetical protein
VANVGWREIIHIGGARYFLKSVILFNREKKHYATLVKLKKSDGSYEWWLMGEGEGCSRLDLAPDEWCFEGWMPCSFVVEKGPPPRRDLNS